ncbi:MAG: hypothetical protein J07HN6_00780 [Halonotius sp. J07HN6]|nr:MAG: hypothetical protein J07HN6_00780 [Halonotius sp. J07HN6]
MVDPAEFGEGDLQRRPAVGAVDEVDLVGDDTGEVVKPRRVVAHQRVDLLAGGDDDVAAGQPLAAGVVVAGRDADREPLFLPAFELGLLLAGEGTKRDDVEGGPAAVDRRQHGEFGDQRLPAGGRHGGDEACAVGDAGLDGLGLGWVQLLDPLAGELVGDPRRQPGNLGWPHCLPLAGGGV